MTISMKKIFAVGALALTLSACGGDKAATETASGSNDVAERQALMKDWRAANEILKGMAENPANFDAELAKQQTQFFVDTSAKIWGYFQDTNAKGDAQDAVWTDAAGFSAATESFNAAAVALNEAAQNATQISDIEAAYGKLAENCGGCHKVFKK